MAKMDMNAMLKQAQQMQEQMVKAQAEARHEIVEASAGGGMVTVKANGGGELVEIVIDPRAIDPDDPELLADMVLAAANEALRSAAEAVESKLRAQMPDLGALGLPGFSGSCENILAHKGALFRFAHVRGLEPTNNRAERALRAFVIWRKTSYGSQSQRGCDFAQRLMTVTETLRQQKRPVFDFLVAACRAAQQGTATPSLLPSR